jgi:hypothetical protein
MLWTLTIVTQVFSIQVLLRSRWHLYFPTVGNLAKQGRGRLVQGEPGRV